jgi:hypothetical protein
VSIAFTPPAKGNSSITPRTATMVRILITWPAMADIDPTKWPTNFSGSYETVTALDRN